jgi:arginase
MLAAEDVLVFGHRIARATAHEQDVLQRRALRTVSDVDVARDPESTAAAALDTLLTPADRLLIHFDVDVIDFTDAPLSEETGRNEGLTLEQAFRALRVFTAHPAFAALTITELNPNHGEADGATLDRFVSGLVEVLKSSTVLARAPRRS